MEADRLRRSVWEEMLYANMRSNYFAELVKHYNDLDKWFRIGTLVAASGTLGTALSQAPDSLKIMIPILSTAISFWLLLSQYGSLARDASDLHSGWNGVARDYEDVWNHLNDPNAEDQYNKIGQRADVLSKSGNKFPNKKKRLQYWLDQASLLAKARYA